jgi:WhiB family redox-sensing transcriptional regulator
VSVYTVPAYFRPDRAAGLPRPPEWTELASCAYIGSDFWFVDKGESTVPAKRVCRSCEVRLRCLETAMACPGEHGVWGGFSERARRGMASEIAGGKSLEDIIAEDDARYYEQIERGTYGDRRPAIERETRRLKREALAATTTSTTQPRKAA